MSRKSHRQRLKRPAYDKPQRSSQVPQVYIITQAAPESKPQGPAGEPGDGKAASWFGRFLGEFTKSMLGL